MKRATKLYVKSQLTFFYERKQNTAMNCTHHVNIFKLLRLNSETKHTYGPIILQFKICFLQEHWTETCLFNRCPPRLIISWGVMPCQPQRVTLGLVTDSKLF